MGHVSLTNGPHSSGFHKAIAAHSLVCVIALN